MTLIIELAINKNLKVILKKLNTNYRILNNDNSSNIIIDDNSSNIIINDNSSNIIFNDNSSNIMNCFNYKDINTIKYLKKYFTPLHI